MLVAFVYEFRKRIQHGTLCTTSNPNSTFALLRAVIDVSYPIHCCVLVMLAPYFVTQATQL